jgi:hypothetical protein
VNVRFWVTAYPQYDADLAERQAHDPDEHTGPRSPSPALILISARWFTRSANRWIRSSAVEFQARPIDAADGADLQRGVERRSVGQFHDEARCGLAPAGDDPAEPFADDDAASRSRQRQVGLAEERLRGQLFGRDLLGDRSARPGPSRRTNRASRPGHRFETG